MRRSFLFATAWALLLPWTAAGQQPPPPEPGFAAFRFPPELVMQNQRRLGLTPAQRATITEAIKDLQAKVLDLQWKLEEQNQRLADLLRGPAVDSAAALGQVDRILEVEHAVKRAHLALLIRIKNTLTEEQGAILRELRSRTLR